MGEGADARAGRRGVPLGDPADQRFRRRPHWSNHEASRCSGRGHGRRRDGGRSSATCHVVSADRDAARLAWLAGRYPVETQVVDLADERCSDRSRGRDADLVVGAVPGFMGFRRSGTVIKAGKSRRGHLVLPRGPVRARRPCADARRDCRGRLRRRAGAQQYHARIPRSRGPCRIVPLPGRRAAGQAVVAVAVQGAVLTHRRARRVHPAGPARGGRLRRHPARVIRA